MHEIENEEAENARVLKCTLNGISLCLFFISPIFHLYLSQVSQNIYLIVWCCCCCCSMLRFSPMPRKSNDNIYLAARWELCKSVKYEMTIEEPLKCFVDSQYVVLQMVQIYTRNSPDIRYDRTEGCSYFIYFIHGIASYRITFALAVQMMMHHRVDYVWIVWI